MAHTAQMDQPAAGLLPFAPKRKTSPAQGMRCCLLTARPPQVDTLPATGLLHPLERGISRQHIVCALDGLKLRQAVPALIISCLLDGSETRSPSLQLREAAS